jgi:hypothetical protein
MKGASSTTRTAISLHVALTEGALYALYSGGLREQTQLTHRAAAQERHRGSADTPRTHTPGGGANAHVPTMCRIWLKMKLWPNKDTRTTSTPRHTNGADTSIDMMYRRELRRHTPQWARALSQPGGGSPVHKSRPPDAHTYAQHRSRSRLAGAHTQAQHTATSPLLCHTYLWSAGDARGEKLWNEWLPSKRFMAVRNASTTSAGAR